MCRSTVDIQSAAAEIRRGKKKDRKKETTGQKYNGLPLQWAAINNQTSFSRVMIKNVLPHFYESQCTCRTTSMPNHVTVASRSTEIWPFEFREISTVREV